MKKIYLPTLIALLFSGSFVAGKYAILDLGPLTTTFLRYLVALIFLIGLIPYYKTSSLKIKKEDIFKLILLGLLGVIGYHFFFFSSLKHTFVINTSIINAFSPVVTGLLAAFFLKERLSKKNYFGILLALIGVLILITKGKIQTLLQLNFNLGDILMLLAVISWAINALIVKNLSQKYSAFTLTFYATASAVILLLFLAIGEGGVTQIQSISVRSIWSILYMGLFASGLGHLLYNYAIKDLGPTKTSSLVYSQVPIFVTLLSFLFFKESLTLPMIVSLGFLVIGLNAVLAKK